MGHQWVVVCFCPSANKCVHAQFAKDYSDEQFPENHIPFHREFPVPPIAQPIDDINPEDDDEVILFS